MKSYKTIVIGNVHTISAFNARVNNALAEISKLGELFDIKYNVCDGYNSAMIIYWVVEYDKE